MTLQVCPFHADADDVVAVPLDAGVTQYTCTRGGHPAPGPYVWESSATGEDLTGTDGSGIMDELDLYTSLVAAVAESKTWVEYGVLEYRFSQSRPDTFKELVAKYGHTNVPTSKRYTASSLLGGCLGRLANSRGELVYMAGKATGYWHYNEPASYYILNNGPVQEQPAKSDPETYAELCTSLGQDPDSVAWWPGVW